MILWEEKIFNVYKESGIAKILSSQFFGISNFLGTISPETNWKMLYPKVI